jgi:hypothetical protein
MHCWARLLVLFYFSFFTEQDYNTLEELFDNLTVFRIVRCGMQ